MCRLNLFLVFTLFFWSCSYNYEDTKSLVESDFETWITIPDTCENVTMQTIENLANNFMILESRSRSSHIIISKIDIVNSSNGQPLLYIVNFASKNGFLVVSATKNYFPILAYSDTGEFYADSESNQEMLNWLEEQKKIISNVNNLADSVKMDCRILWETICLKHEKFCMNKSRSTSDNVANLIMSNISLWRSQGYEVYCLSDFKTTDEFLSLPSDVQANFLTYPNGYANQNYGGVENVSYILKKDIGESINILPLTSTTWGQEEGYNTYTPNNYPAGCTAVAMGQVMKYHEYPNDFIWENMADNYSTSATASFLAEIGAKIGVKYSSDKSSANISEVCTALKEYGYTNANIISHSESKVINEIRSNRPVIMRGHDEAGNHEWVCDGVRYGNTVYEYKLMTLEDCPESVEPTCFLNPYSYSNNISYSPTYFHMNWGWYGDGNGYYKDSDIKVVLSPSESYNFKDDRKEIINIYPVQ